MKYLSVCSGIEAATVAWHGLGWTPVAFSEIEAFPAAVLAHHYPTVPNLGDLTKYRGWPEELLAEVDLLVGGTPCQAFSVAGKRQSLDDERGNLSLVYVNLYHHINEVRKRHGRPPAIALWENVPGVLSTKDNAFGCFIGGLLGCDEAPETESGKWDKAGFLGSETVRVGYRVLDAQYFGVAQRRRRVFLVAVPCELVASLGERACPSEILSLRESVLGNPPTRGAAREGVARATASGLTSSGRGVERCGESRGRDDVVIWSASDQANAERFVDQAGTLNCNMGQRGGWIAGHPDPAYAISAGNQSKGGVFGSGRDSQDTFVTCFHPTQDPISSTDGSTHAVSTGSGGGCATHAVCVTGQRSHALTTRAAACEEDGTGRGTPIVTHGGVFDGAVAFTQNSRDEVRMINGDGRIAGSIGADGGMHQTNYLAYGVTTEQTPKVSEETALTITRQSPSGGGQPQCVAFANRTRDGIKVPEVMKDGVVPALTNPGNGGRSDAVNVVVPCGVDFQNCATTGDVCGTLMGEAQKKGGEAGHGIMESVKAFSPLQGGRSMPVTDEAPTLEAGTGNKTPAVAFQSRLARCDRGQPEVEISSAINGSNAGATSDMRPCVASAMQVRRLTPTECAYLQGFPSDYLDIIFRKKPAADGPKYRALGNSMAVPCMWWLGYRIDKATRRDNP